MTLRALITAIVEQLVGPRIDYRTVYRFRVVAQSSDGSLNVEPVNGRLEAARRSVDAATRGVSTAEGALESAIAARDAASSLEKAAAEVKVAEQTKAVERARRVLKAAQDDLNNMAAAPRVSKVPSLTKVPIVYGTPGMTAKVKKGSMVFLEFAGGDATDPIVVGWEPGAAEEIDLDAALVKLGGGARNIAREGDPVAVILTPAAVSAAATGKASLAGWILRGSDKVKTA